MIKIVVKLIFCFFICSPIYCYCQLPENDSNYMRLMQIIITDNGGTDIDLDNENNIYLLNSKKNKLYKYLAYTKYDSVYSLGGTSTRSEGFFHPIKVSAKNRQSVFVLDDVKRKVTLLNTNLKIMGELNFPDNENRTLEDVFPISFDLSEWGDLFVLNYTDNKIYKFNERGYDNLSFGGLDYGEGQLYSPINLSINHQNFIFVGDTSGQVVKVFDIYGVYQYSISTVKLFSYRWKGFSISGENIVFFDDKNITLYHLASDQILSLPLRGTMNEKGIKDVVLKNNTLYILNNSCIFVFSL